jgi:hypothetical protein
MVKGPTCTDAVQRAECTFLLLRSCTIFCANPEGHVAVDLSFVRILVPRVNSGFPWRNCCWYQPSEKCERRSVHAHSSSCCNVKRVVKVQLNTESCYKARGLCCWLESCKSAYVGCVCVCVWAYLHGRYWLTMWTNTKWNIFSRLLTPWK